MKILGISPEVWISSAALLDNGKVVAAAPEERFNRQKMYSRFPDKAIDFCLEQAGCGIEDIDRVVIPWNPGVHIRSASSRYTHTMRWRGEFLAGVPGALLNHFGSPDVPGIEQIVPINGKDVHISYINHHMAHAAGAFYLSPYERAAVMTVDGRGEMETCTWSLADGNEIKQLRATNMPHSLGLFYSSLTEYLGFRPHSDEWKVMALASYGAPNNKYTDLVRSLVKLLDDGGFEQDLTYFDYFQFDRQPTFYNSKLMDLLGPARTADMPFEQRHSDIAWAMQAVFEETFVHMLKHLHNITGEKRLVISGGAAMNSVFNGKITDMTPFDEVFITSCPDDSGVSLGAALYSYHCQLGGTEREVQTHNYWGPEYSDDEIAEALSRCGIEAVKHDNIEEVVAKLLAEGALVGWFQGAMEFGQRALGNRSILADPRNPQAKDQINAAVKFREGFRPFAPAILDGYAEEYFDIPTGLKVPFMEKVYPFKEDKRAGLPAVVHVDGSGRLQTVDSETNPRFHKLISEFHKITGVPIVVNTSFNLNGEPVVCSPVDAIRTFYSCGLQALAIGSFLLTK
jgi:carbamoyltransferase